MTLKLDHLLLGIADLKHGIEWVYEKTGVYAMQGGIHPGAGTCNAILSLNNHQYLEIIALDPTQNRTSRIATLIQNLSYPRFITWAAATANIQLACHRLQEQEYQMEGPLEGARMTPAGDMLQWKTAKLTEFDEAIPFLIEWAPGTVHPSQSSPSGCRLEEFAVTHPEADRVRELFRTLGIGIEVNKGNPPELHALLATPKGKLLL